MRDKQRERDKGIKWEKDLQENEMKKNGKPFKRQLISVMGTVFFQAPQ